MRTGVKVLDAMTKKPVFVEGSISVAACAKLMTTKKVGSVLVNRGGVFTGIATEKDFLEKVMAKGLSPNDVTVGDVMTTKLVTIAPDEDLYDAMMKMKDEDVRRLPVVHNKSLVGVLTIKDILTIEPQLFDYMAERFRVRRR